MKAFAPVRTVAPVGELVSLAGAKVQCRVEGDEEDASIASLVSAATDHLDGYAGVLGQALLTQTWTQSLDCFPCGRELRLPLGPLGETATIAYFDAAGAVQAFTAFSAMTDAIGPVLHLDWDASWPSTAWRPDAVTVTWTCGFGDDASTVPAGIVHAVKLMVGHWYVNREAVNVGNIVNAFPWAVDALLAPHRKVGV